MEGRTVFSVRLVASNPETRERGLMFAEPLHTNEAALFVFPSSARYAFWNKNVSFPLSLAFLDDNRRVVDFGELPAHSTVPVAPCEDARYVVEASQGAFTRLGVRKGDMIEYQDHALHVKRIASNAR